MQHQVIRSACLSLLGILPALSSTITTTQSGFTLTATASLTVPQDLANYSQVYTLTVTGGQGSGFAFPAWTLNGVTNEDTLHWAALGAEAIINLRGAWGQNGGFAGDPYGAAISNPVLSCRTDYPLCAIPFTFDVPQTVAVYASVLAAYQPGPHPAPPWTFPEAAPGSVVFDGDSFIVYQQGQWDQGAVVTFIDPPAVDTPEPETWAMVLTVLIAVVAARRVGRISL
jgi:hypothetical protein